MEGSKEAFIGHTAQETDHDEKRHLKVGDEHNEIDQEVTQTSFYHAKKSGSEASLPI